MSAPRQPVYALREDLRLALPHAFEREVCDLHEGISEALGEALGERAQVVGVSYEQLRLPQPCVSLDPWIPAEHTLRVSRAFLAADKGGDQRRGERLVASPEAPALEIQLEQLPEGDVWLVDDDIASGQTMRWARELVEKWRPDVRVLGDIALLPYALRRHGEREVLDVVDARDFVWGAQAGGLVLAEREGLTRHPYLAPQVNLGTRAKLPAPKHSEFTQRVWELNRSYWARRPAHTLGQLPAPQARALQVRGWDLSLPVKQFCSQQAALVSD